MRLLPCFVALVDRLPEVRQLSTDLLGVLRAPISSQLQERTEESSPAVSELWQRRGGAPTRDGDWEGGRS